MKTTYLILTLALLLTAATYYDGDSFKFNGYEHNITSVIQDRVVMDTEYGRYLLRDGDCEVVDTHLWCITSLTFNEVEFYPNEYEINLTRERMCSRSECQPYGSECESNNICMDYCVNGYCRPERTWCGDGVCDEAEACAADCPAQVENTTAQMNSTQETNTTTNQTQETNTTEVVEENTSQANTEQETQTETSLGGEPTAASSASDEPNYIAGGAVMAIGIIAIFFIISRHQKKKKDKPDLYSFK